MSKWRIPLSDLDYGQQELAAVQRVLQSKWLSMGPEVAEFEREFAEHHQVAEAVAVANATAALHLALAAHEIGSGDEVIQPALNFVAAANTTIACGAIPVFADIGGLDDPAIDPEQVERLISSRTKAVVVMHYGGRLGPLARLQEICGRHGLLLIEDACHAVGVEYRGAARETTGSGYAGGIGDVGAFSFFSNKNLATGEGGMVVTNSAAVAERLRLLRSHGMTTLTWDRHRGHARSYDVQRHGFNYRIDEIRAALGRVQLAKLAQNNARRRTLLQYYQTGLADLGGWRLPLTAAGDTSGHLMVAVAPTAELREKVTEHLHEHGIQTSLHYPCITDFTAFESYKSAAVARTREFSARAISLPIFPTMTPDQVGQVCDLVKQAALK